MKRMIWTPLVALVASLVMVGCEKKQAAQQAPPPEVVVTTVVPEKITLTTELPGRTSAYLMSEIRPQVNGLIQKRLFTEGSDVKAGQVLYQIDPAPFQAAYDSARASLAASQKAVERSRAALAVSIANVTREQATLALAKTNRQRAEDLFRERAMAESDRDKAATDYDVAEASLKAAEADVTSGRAGIEAADAAVKQAEAAVETSKISLGYTKITAPISGRIGRSSVTEGAIVTAYQPSQLATIQSLDPIYVDVPQSTMDLGRLRRNLQSGRLQKSDSDQRRVKLTMEDDSAYPHEGTLKFRDVTVDPTTGSVILRIEVPNPESVLLPGMFVRAIIEEGVNEQAILVPQQAITRDPRGNALAMVLDADGKVQQRQLTADRAIGDKWLVSSGLSKGDRVIVEGLQKVRPGSPAKIAEGKQASAATAPSAAASVTK